eukprot:scaffold379_cov235-Pinguiococcus_pyrenoidosus.AAC.10
MKLERRSSGADSCFFDMLVASDFDDRRLMLSGRATAQDSGRSWADRLLPSLRVEVLRGCEICNTLSRAWYFDFHRCRLTWGSRRCGHRGNWREALWTFVLVLLHCSVRTVASLRRRCSCSASTGPATAPPMFVVGTRERAGRGKGIPCRGRPPAAAAAAAVAAPAAASFLGERWVETPSTPWTASPGLLESPAGRRTGRNVLVLSVREMLRKLLAR